MHTQVAVVHVARHRACSRYLRGTDDEAEGRKMYYIILLNFLILQNLYVFMKGIITVQVYLLLNPAFYLEYPGTYLIVCFSLFLLFISSVQYLSPADKI